MPDLDPDDESEPLFSIEPFCGIISETTLPENDPDRFEVAATRFCNERLWGTLCAEIVTPRDPELRPSVEEAVRVLRYAHVIRRRRVPEGAAAGYLSEAAAIPAWPSPPQVGRARPPESSVQRRRMCGFGAGEPDHRIPR